MADAVWNGFLRLSLVSCPVRLRPATTEAPAIRLEQLNSRTGNPVAQQFVDSRTGDVIPADAVVMGCQAGTSGYVTINDSELATLSAGTRNIVEVSAFCPRDQVDRARFEASYYLYPEGELAANTLAALRLAMQRSDCEAIAYVNLGERERMVLIQPCSAGLMLSTLRPPRVPEPAQFVERPGSEIPGEMVEVAQSIIARRLLAGDANALPDRYEERLRALIAEKTGGGANLPQVEPPPEPRPAALDAAPAPEREPEGSVLAGAPDLESIPVAPPPQEPVPGPEPEHPGAILSGEPEPSPNSDATEVEASAPPLAAEDNPRELGAEILLHIMGLGDRRFVDPGWAGNRGSRQQIEAMSIRPLAEFEPSALEFRVFAEQGRATTWVSNGSYAGTRDKQLPLTGFAVRPAPELHDRFDVVYEGSFFDGGVVGPKRNGEICMSPVPDDPLEAVRVSIVERQN